jgi:hypothetical protein
MNIAALVLASFPSEIVYQKIHQSVYLTGAEEKTTGQSLSKLNDPEKVPDTRLPTDLASNQDSEQRDAKSLSSDDNVAGWKFFRQNYNACPNLAQVVSEVAATSI